MKKVLLTSILFLVAAILSAHEFWLQPDKFIYKSGEPVNIRLLVGENFEGENWSGDTSKIQSLNFYYNNIKDDLRDAMGTGKGDSIQLSLMDEGTAMVTYNSKNSFIELDFAKFNAYLLEDGITNAIDYRTQHHEMDSAGHEFYQRSVKTIFQVGDIYDDAFLQQTNLPIDIIPQVNPYAIKNKDSITVKLFFKNKPLMNSLINVWHRENNKTTKEELTTNDKGEITLAVETSGEWMVSCVKMERLTGNPKAQWQSYWGSCTWGYCGGE